jgi:hypothetical protein
MTDLIRSIYSPYQTFVQNQILYLKKKFAIFWVGRNRHCWTIQNS